MRILAKMLTGVEPAKVRVEHKGEEYEFQVSVFGRGSFQTHDVFEQLNRYWESLSEERQLEIFNIYKDLHYMITNTWDDKNNVWTRQELNNTLSDKVAELMAVHNLTEIKNWLVYTYKLNVPAKFKPTYEESTDYSTTREKTYTRTDYIKLATLSMLMRSLIPLWGSYIIYIRDDVGNTFKEFYAFQLLIKSPVMECEAMEKLKVYIDEIIGDNKMTFNSLLSSISSEDYTDNMLAIVVIRRLSICDIRGLDPNANPVTFIYKYVFEKIKKDSDTEASVYKPKKTEEDVTGDRNDKISNIEKYKIKPNLSIEDVVELEYSLRDPMEVAKKISYQVDPEFLKRCLDTSNKLMNERLLDPQITLLRWVFKPVISPKGVLYLSKQTIVRSLGILQAVLWTRGHKYLALLATSHTVISDEVMRIAPIDSKMRIDKDYIDKLNQLYPYTRTTYSKKNDPTVQNAVFDSINLLVNDLTKFSWRPTADEELLQEVFGRTSRILPIVPDIKTHLSELLIQIAQRTGM